MSARDELITDLGDSAVPVGGVYAIRTPIAADHLLELGYRKPRTITTAEELDALPVGSVVLSDVYRHFVDGWQVSFQRWQDGDWHRGARGLSTDPDNFLPATVLHEGTQP